MEILITGGNGFLGRNLIKALQERGDSARVLALSTEDTAWLEECGVAVYRGDIRESNMLTVPMRGVDTVFHLAGMMGLWRSMQDYYAVNVTGTENVCQAALTAGARRLIHVSSWTVYGMNLGRPVTEVAHLLGHSNPAITLKVYAHWFKNETSDAISVLSAELFVVGIDT